MKKLLLASIFVAVALAVQAGDAKTSKVQKVSKDESPCCSAKTSTSVKTVTLTSTTADKDKMGCCSEAPCKVAPAKVTVLLSPKGRELARK